MDDKNEASWVLDSLVGFLKSPVWNLSVLNFIEQKSVIFEPETEDQNDVLEQEYSKIFNEYKEMVDTLLASHMEDLEITPEQFENACLTAKDNLGSKLHSILFEQLWSAFNYRIFKRMMIQRNIDLQLQALELLGQKLNVSSEALNASSLSPESQICEEEFELMRELFKRSLGSNLGQTDDQQQSSTETVTKKIEQTVSTSEESNEEENKKEEVKENVYIENEEAKKSETNDTQVKIRPGALIDKILNNNNRNDDKNQNNQLEQLDNEQKMLLLMGTKDGQQKISKEELEKRQNYLRTQRDKLIKLKYKERTKQIEKVGDEQQSTGRPKSARALRSSLKKSSLFIAEEDEEKVDKEKNSKTEEDKENNNNNDSNNGYRRMLAAKLKAELIGGSINSFRGEVQKVIEPSTAENN